MAKKTSSIKQQPGKGFVLTVNGKVVGNFPSRAAAQKRLNSMKGKK